MDLVALEAYVMADARLKGKLESGANGELAAEINATADTGTVPIAVSRRDLFDAIGDGIRSLTADQLQRLRLLTNDDPVDLTSTAIRDELREILVGQTAALTRLTAVAIRPKRLADRFGAEQVSIADIRAVARAVPSSMINKYERGEV